MRAPAARWGLVAGIVGACVAYLVITSTASSAAYYVTIKELRAHPPAGDARVLGTVQDDIRRGDGGLRVAFTAAEGSQTLPVDYRGSVPDIFTPGVQVVVEGRLGPDGVFHAKTLLAKCPSRFSSAKPAQ